jgi:hypothetical protein
MVHLRSNMPSFDELEALWRETPRPPRDRGVVRVIVVRTGPGEHATPSRVALSPQGGVDGDRWSSGVAPQVDAQVTLMEAGVVRVLAGGDAGRLHLPGDNFQVELDLGATALPVGSRLRLGTALLEVTAKPHTGCRKFSDRFGADALRWVNEPELRDRRLRGVHGRVVEAGEVAIGGDVWVEWRAGAGAT